MQSETQERIYAVRRCEEIMIMMKNTLESFCKDLNLVRNRSFRPRSPLPVPVLEFCSNPETLLSLRSKNVKRRLVELQRTRSQDNKRKRSFELSKHRGTTSIDTFVSLFSMSMQHKHLAEMLKSLSYIVTFCVLPFPMIRRTFMFSSTGALARRTFAHV